jgi:hypothetical protein
MYMDGHNFRRIARHLKVNHRTVSLWVTGQTHSLPEALVPEEAMEVHGKSFPRLYVVPPNFDKRRKVNL